MYTGLYNYTILSIIMYCVHTYNVCRYEMRIDKILKCAVKEQELENEFRTIEERWSEQVHYIIKRSIVPQYNKVYI